MTIGQLFLGFLDYYGNIFDYITQAIAPANQNGIVEKASLNGLYKNGSKPSILCIQDPLDYGNDVGKSSFDVLKIKSYFKYAYTNLIAGLNSNNPIINKNSRTILGRIILITPEVISYRNFIRDWFMKHNSYKQNEPEEPKILNR